MIELINLSKVYGKSNTEVKALNEVNLEINEGEMIAIMGPSGSGKSTLLNILGGLDSPTSGEYLLKNRNVQNMKQKELSKVRNRTFGFVVQSFALIDHYSVFNNVMIPLDYTKLKKADKKEKIRLCLDKVGILDKSKNYPYELSGGQCQRVAIARALVNTPDVILADEPTGNLDKNNGEQIIEIFKELNKAKTTIIIITHDDEVASKCNRVIRLEDGRII
ncbi:ABC transporter ATP-binding protein [Enterococcus wangshanyuanii]|uniref:ABC transporter ATP-binding protein n=1 Tax=Enterococcus wangshanyuanii TaxID=2005703 RepID=A0ABQ1NPI5_9ENTE|nr:ABC transporter ATP-binding protein [Enterococcus wangshanyuanii]GGC82270.1 ABC transporter ATP-binding protein [Enterococcus wangshanyuanii]